MNVPDEYRTGNRGMDTLIAKALEKENANKIPVVKKDYLNITTQAVNRTLASLDGLTEDEECEMLVGHLDNLLMLHLIDNYTHIPNETYTPHDSIKRKNKELGVRPGFPDYAIMTTKHFIVIEMKRKKGGVVSGYQQKWIDQFTALGIPAKVCNGFLEAEAFIAQYL